MTAPKRCAMTLIKTDGRTIENSDGSLVFKLVDARRDGGWFFHRGRRWFAAFAPDGRAHCYTVGGRARS